MKAEGNVTFGADFNQEILFAAKAKRKMD